MKLRYLLAAMLAVIALNTSILVATTNPSDPNKNEEMLREAVKNSLNQGLTWKGENYSLWGSKEIGRLLTARTLLENPALKSREVLPLVVDRTFIGDIRKNLMSTCQHGRFFSRSDDDCKQVIEYAAYVCQQVDLMDDKQAEPNDLVIAEKMKLKALVAVYTDSLKK